MMYKFIILCGRYRFFSSLSLYHGLDMFLATRDALVINGSCQGLYHLTWNKGIDRKKQEENIYLSTEAVAWQNRHVPLKTSKKQINRSPRHHCEGGCTTPSKSTKFKSPAKSRPSNCCSIQRRTTSTRKTQANRMSWAAMFCVQPSVCCGYSMVVPTLGQLL